MRRGCAGLIATVLALAGCKSTDPKPTDKDTAGTPTARAKNDGKGPSWLDPADRLPSNERPEVADARNLASQDCVGGRVLDQSNRPVAGVYIQVEAVNPPPGSPAPVGIFTDPNGAFFTRGLKPGRAYNLTAEATLNGKPLTASVQTAIPKTDISLVLQDDLGLPSTGNSKGASAGSFPPPPSPFEPGGDRIPPTSVGQPVPRSTDGAWAPGADASKPLPATINPSTQRQGPGGSLPPPDDLTFPVKPPIRPENVADRPTPWVGPPVSIPGPPSLPPTYPNPSPNPAPPPSPPAPARMGLSGIGNGFILLDSQGRSWEFPTNKSGSLVLVEFMTTYCKPSKDTIPVLTDLQARYATAGLQVIAVACDETEPSKPPVNQKQRMEAAAKYMRENTLNYQVFVEPGEVSGGVRERYNVTHYPTAVLLNGSGAILWQGHPNKRAELEAAVKKALGQ
jgi:thiol-disulfide isomerase/thioredoxin